MTTRRAQSRFPWTCQARAISLLLLCAAPVFCELRVSDVRKESPKPESIFKDDLLYSLASGDLHAQLGFRRDVNRLRFEVSRGGNIHSSAEIAAARKMEFLQPLMERFLNEQGRAAQYNFAMNYYTEMGTRIADAASSSEQWDHQLGRTRKRGDDFNFILLQQTNAPFIELARMMHSVHYQVTVEAIENRIVLPFKEVSQYEKSLMKVTPKPDDLLPFGASVNFVLRKEK